MMRFNTAPINEQSTQIHRRAVRLVAASLLGLTCTIQAVAAPAVPWHPDLDQAQRASERSRRPVLAIFTASWTAAAAAIDGTALSSEEAVALVTACFEPVCVDVDSNPEATRRLGISKVPTACILTSDSQILSKFELPATPAEFVAAAARAAQDAAFVTAQSQSVPRSVAVEVEQIAARRPATDLPVAGSTFGSSGHRELRSAAIGQAPGLAPPGGRAITTVAAKVRMLSDFASVDCPTIGSGDTIAASFREASLPPSAAQASPGAENPGLPPATVAVQPAATPAASVPSTAAVAAPAESLAGSVPGGPLDLDPAAPPMMPAATAAAPWLAASEAARSAPPQQSSQTPNSQQSAAVAVAPQKEIEPQPAAPETAVAGPAASKPETPPTASGASSLLAALQKPFTMLSRPVAPKNEPQSRDAQPAQASPNATASAPAEPDQYGSMPVGLEGYCPVTLAERGLWIEGRAQWGVRHRGRTYLFANEQQQKAFLADPDRYAPALSGDDPVLAFDAGKSTPGQRRYGVTYQSRMYLFSSPETRDAFAANPQRYTAGIFVAENRGTSVAAGGSVIR